MLHTANIMLRHAGFDHECAEYWRRVHPCLKFVHHNKHKTQLQSKRCRKKKEVVELLGVPAAVPQPHERKHVFLSYPGDERFAAVANPQKWRICCSSPHSESPVSSIKSRSYQDSCMTK